MDNNSKKLNSLVAAAILGLSNLAVANEDCQRTFTPIENLQPEEREVLVRKIELLREHVQIDWRTVVIGVSEDGQLIIKARKPDENNPVGNPSCWTK